MALRRTFFSWVQDVRAHQAPVTFICAHHKRRTRPDSLPHPHLDRPSCISVLLNPPLTPTPHLPSFLHFVRSHHLPYPCRVLGVLHRLLGHRHLRTAENGTTSPARLTRGAENAKPPWLYWGPTLHAHLQWTLPLHEWRSVYLGFHSTVETSGIWSYISLFYFYFLKTDLILVPVLLLFIFIFVF